MVHSYVLRGSLLAAALLASTISPAASGDPKTVPVLAVYAMPLPEGASRQTVSYRDLNLSNVEGERTLGRRVERAVIEVCSALDTGAKANFEMTYCRSFARKGAQPQIAAAVLRAQELASTGKSSIAVAAIIVSSPVL